MLSSAVSLYSLSLSETLWFSSCLFKAPLLSPMIGLLTHAWARTANNNGAAVLIQFLDAKLDAEGMDFANVWHGEVVWCPKVTELKAILPTRRFRSSVSGGMEELLLVWTIKHPVGKGSKWVILSSHTDCNN